jgi:hypothetical protein
MEESEHLRQTLEHYRQQRQKHLEEVKRIEMMIGQLEQDLGEAPSVDSTRGDSQGLTASTPVAIPGTRVLPTVRPDEFYGMSQTDAAKAFLKKVGYAINFAHLVSALQRGGAKLGGADPQKTLYVSLARNPKKEFVWPSKDHIGLKEFYDRKS